MTPPIPKNIIDVHAHLAAFPDGKNGCLMAPSYQKGISSTLIRWSLGIKGKTNEELNESYIEKLTAAIHDSIYVNRAILLALDGVYDEAGKLDENKTQMLISNDYVFHVCSRSPGVFFAGASVNPQRRDAIDELHRVIERGAKLIKVLPNSQIFDPTDKKYIPFYRVLAEKNIPYLSHIGHEHTVTAGNQSYGNPNRLRLALEEGVTVIGAHGCSSGNFFHGAFYKMMLDLTSRFQNLFLDLSALAIQNTVGMAYRLRHHPELFNRFLFGTDYPISPFMTPLLPIVPFSKQWKISRTKNIFDKQALILNAIGLQFNTAMAERIIQ